MNKSRLHILVLLFSLTVTIFLFPREKLYAANSGTCGAEGGNLTWTLDDEGTLTVSGTGEMGNWQSYHSPWNNYTGEIKKVVIGEGVTSISSYAFLECSKLIDVEISGSVTYIGNNAFGCCTSLEDIEIPGNVKTIDGSFSDCNNLKKVVLTEGLVTIGGGAFACCESLQEIVIPEGVTLIGDFAFNGCKSLQEIVIPEGVTSIGHYAFSSCGNLKEIAISGSVTSIGHYAFSSCGNLKEIAISEGVSSIGRNAFLGCFSLQEIIIPESVSSIGESAFNACDSLTHVFIPKKLYGEINLESIIENSSEDLFCQYSCTNDGNGTTSLKSVDFESGEVIFNVVPNENFEVDKIYWIDSSGTSEPMDYYYDNGECYFEIPESGMNNLFIHATFRRISATVTFCSEDGTNILQSRTYMLYAIPSYTDDIPVKEPDGDTTYVFAGWSDGTVTYGINDQLPAVTDDVTYTAVFEKVCSTITGTCGADGDNLTWTLDDEGTLTISGTGDMGSDYYTNSPWYEYKEKISEVVIDDGVTSIGEGAFIRCVILKKAVISEGVTIIEDNAFFGCSTLKEIVIPEGVTSIGEKAFYSCFSLQEIVVPEGVNSIEGYVFFNCTSLQEIVIPETVTSIGERAFKGCGSLNHVFIPKTLYNELDLKNVFEISSEGIFHVYSFTSDGNGTTNLKSIDLKSGKVVLNVVPNENFEIDKIYRIDSSGASKSMYYDYANGEVFFDIPESEMNNLAIHVTFKRVRATVTFCSEDGTNILQSGTYKINEIPSYTEDIPVKEPDGDTTFIFAGWSDGTVTYGINDQLPAVTDNVTYTAVFEEVPQYIPPVFLYKLSSIEGEDKRADIVFRINRNEDDENCISYFRSVAVDDVLLANGTQYSVEKGSTVITLKSDYLKTLSEGEHTITVNFKDGTVTASFNNLKRDAESIPATGETAIKATVGVVLVLAAVSGLAVVLIKRKKTEK